MICSSEKRFRLICRSLLRVGLYLLLEEETGVRSMKI